MSKYMHCRRCGGKNYSRRKVCLECIRKQKRIEKQKLVDRARRERYAELARLVSHCGALEAAEAVYQQTLANWYLYGRWSENSNRDQIWAIRQFQIDMTKWMSDPDTSWHQRFRYMMAMVKIGELRSIREIQEHNGNPPSCETDLKKAPKKELVGWIRKLLQDGYLTLDDLDPAPIIDEYDYGWHAESR